MDINQVIREIHDVHALCYNVFYAVGDTQYIRTAGYVERERA